MTLLINGKDCAALLGTSAWNITTWANKGKLPYVLVGKVRKYDPDIVLSLRGTLMGQQGGRPRSAACGTYSAIYAHKKYNEPLDEVCASLRRELQPCGTAGAYNRHLAHGEDACEPCKAANTRKTREYLDPLGRNSAERSTAWNKNNRERYNKYQLNYYHNVKKLKK